MVICGQEFSFSALNANDLERMDTAQKHLNAASDRESKHPHSGPADVLRGQCRLMMDYFDELLGKGASERLGLDGNDFGACARVVEAIKAGITAEQAEMKQVAAAPTNREQRRAEKKYKRPVSRSEGFNPQVVTAAKISERADKAARRQQLLAELAALEND